MSATNRNEGGHTTAGRSDGALVLASRSPRRATLLREAGYEFLQLDPPFADPVAPQGGRATELAAELASGKADSLVGAGSSGPLKGLDHTVVLAADTIVVGPDGGLLGQPGSRAEAHRMLMELLDRVHQVVTAVAITDERGRRRETLVDAARVQLGPVGLGELNDYLDRGGWRGKAGGYNLLELEGQWPIKVAGDPTTVVGLPMRQLRQALAGWAVHPQRPASRKLQAWLEPPDRRSATESRHA